MKRMLPIVLALAAAFGLQAQTAPLEVEAKFLKVLLTSTGQFGFACNDETLKAKLEEMGVSVGPGFKIAWATSEAEVKALKAQNRFILCANASWLRLGACLAVVDEGGRPKLYMHPENVKASGVTLPDNIVKIAMRATP